MNKSKRVVIALVMLLAFAHLAVAQEAPAPKWGSKVQKALLSVLTYDKDNNLLKSGTGFYVSADGVAIADYQLFDGAYSAVVVDASGVKSDVVSILGADDAYSLVRFKVKAKKSTPLTIASSKASDGAMVFALKYSKDKVSTCPSATVNEVKMVNGNCPYYTLSYAIDESYHGAPLFNANGELVATVQPAMGLNGYALGIQFIDTLKIQAITSKMNGLALEKIHIFKGLPDTAEEALVYLYMRSGSMNNDDYLNALNTFVETYPDNPEGYNRRAGLFVDLHRFEDAEADLETFYKLSADKAVANSKIADVIYTKLVYQPTPVYEKWTYDYALGYINKAVEEKGDVLEYKLLKAQILMAKHDYAEALEVYDVINNSEMRRPATLYAACLAHEGLGDTVTIQIELLDSAIAMFGTPTPADAATYVLRRGRLNAVIERYREAVNDYNQYCFLVNNKVNESFYYDRYQLELKGRLYQQALDDLNTAIGLAPRQSLYYIEKCALLLRVNELDECIMTAKEVLEFDPKNVDAIRIMGYAQVQNGDATTGKQNLQKAVEMGDDAAKELLEKYVK